MCKNKSAGKQPRRKTLRIVLQPGGAPPGTVNSLSGTSAGHIQTHWGFVLGLSASETKWKLTVSLSLSRESLPPFQGNTSVLIIGVNLWRFAKLLLLGIVFHTAFSLWRCSKSLPSLGWQGKWQLTLHQPMPLHACSSWAKTKQLLLLQTLSCCSCLTQAEHR